MQAQALLELVRTGNASIVEQQWSTLLESADAEPSRLKAYDVVLQELCRAGKGSVAEELAWTALEVASSRFPAADVLGIAGPFLLAVGESETLRAEVANLYRAAFASREGLEELLSEAGLAGGRPVRRALRTLDVCLPLKEGDFLAAREEDSAARVASVVLPDWKFQLTTPDGDETVGAVALADRYRPVPPEDFRVMRQFARDALVSRLWDDPTPIVLALCREREKGLPDSTLESLLVPDLIGQDDWKKWWTQARAALKRCSQIKLEGRSPYILTYVHAPTATQDELLADFDARHEPLEKLAALERYLRDCKARSESPHEDTLRQCVSKLHARAEQLSAAGSDFAGMWWIAAHRAAKASGLTVDSGPAVAWFRSAGDLSVVFRQLDDAAIFHMACDWLAAARPERWREELLEMLPRLTLAVCDHVAGRLIEAGKGPADFEPVVQAILASPVPSFEALMWLWDGPAKADQIPVPPLSSLISRILRTLDDCRRDEKLTKEAARRIAACGRSVLSARQFERFRQFLEQVDAGVANTFVRQIRHLDSLGRAVPEDMVSLIRRRFPPVKEQKQERHPWEQEDVVLVTAAGLGKKQDEIHHHVNVKMKENAIAIGRAAEHGDLSENSEYKFALEERDLLRARLAQMNAEVAAARVLSPTDVPANYVGVGSRVFFARVTDGDRYVMTIVGPWEADATQRLFNYKAPLCMKVLGKRIGDTVEFEHSGIVGEYRIVALENALATPETEGAARGGDPASSAATSAA